ncbi:MAG: 4-(cytidine 5-diphospho)-2-C-methyl-D-erythritol kinase [Actinomycetota bacterium]
MSCAKAYGKVNLFFQVGPLKEDGYHDVVSLYQAIDLHEKVCVEPAPMWQVEVWSDLFDVGSVPVDETNIVVKAAKLLAAEVGIDNPQPMKFQIEKQIPVAGGMAGGSADAAAALVALNDAWCLGLGSAELMTVGAKVGADVPFAILGGTAIGIGTGTELTKVPTDFDKHIVLLFPGLELPTKKVFEAFDQLELGEVLDKAPSPEDLIDRLGYNSLKTAALSLLPELKAISERDFGLGKAFLSGSGPTLWYLANSAIQAHEAVARMKAAGFKALVTKATSAGCELY